MGNSEGRNLDVADFESRTRTYKFHAFELRLRTVRISLLDFAIRRFGQVRGTFPVTRKLRKSAAMVGMFVRYEDCVNAFRAAATERFESPQHFFAAKTGVDEESGVFRFEQRAVARAAGGKNGNPERDASALGAGVET